MTKLEGIAEIFMVFHDGVIMSHNSADGVLRLTIQNLPG